MFGPLTKKLSARYGYPSRSPLDRLTTTTKTKEIAMEKTEAEKLKKKTEAAQNLLDAVIKATPSTFELTAFAGTQFRISRTASYVTTEGAARVVVQRLDTKTNAWLDFSKGSIDEFVRELARPAKKAVEHAMVEHVPYLSMDEYIKAIAEKHTVLNLGQPWPETTYQRLRFECESDEMHDATVEEYRSWLDGARKEAEMVAKAGLPLTLANADDAFMRKGVFAKAPKRTKTKKAGPALNRKPKSAGPAVARKAKAAR